MAETAEIKKQYNTAPYDASRAFDPNMSVFVAANAGAGKTTLLTQRVLALLLSGVAPSRLLCLTYTNAGASEMNNRVLRRLGRWVMCPEDRLSQELEQLLCHPPGPQQVSFARSLFARVLEAPEGIRILTLHSFCQSLLRRFPVEAEINPHFKLMDTRSEEELLKEARLRLFTRARSEDAVLRESLRAAAGVISEFTLRKLIDELISSKRRIRPALRNSASKSAKDVAFEMFGLSAGDTESSLVEGCFAINDASRTRMKALCRVLLAAEKTDIKLGDAMAAFLEGRISLSDYARAFLTQKGEILERLYTKKAAISADDAAFIRAQAECARQAAERLVSLETAIKTSHALIITRALLEIYDTLKQQQGLVDYDDLILAARDLLHKPGISPWVLFKLDGGIDQVLIDEAQDTSPEQWDIVEALTGEFFDGLSSGACGRSLFIVGDEKQSIFSFQGAAPRELGNKQGMFAEKIRHAARPLYPLVLNQSYRSAGEVLRVVDSVFALPEARQGLTYADTRMEHIVTRTSAAGLVELWPLCKPLTAGGEVVLSSRAVLARHIASTIRGWLDSGQRLESRDRALQPGDIIILVQKRRGLVDQLVRSLKKLNVPVSGHDRMNLSDNLAVKDLVALGRCLLLPEDSLTLAALLKSPIFNLDDDDLMELCMGRGGKSLFDCLQARPDVCTLFADLRARVDYLSPYDMYAYVLDTLGMRSRILGRMGEEYNDAIDEFLGQALLYERSHTASMQGFLAWLDASDSQIKRDMEQTANCVRIMTVHGAKGLQAPVVILPDTGESSGAKNTLKWLPQSPGALPVWPLTGDSKARLVSALGEVEKTEAMAEYRRLLYVALTRAEDRLYICGAGSDKEVSAGSWYGLVQAGMKGIASAFDTPDGSGLRLGAVPPQGRAAESNHTPKGYEAAALQPASFLCNPPPEEPVPSEPLTPSRMGDDEPAAASPLAAAQPDRFGRGNLVHELLQYIADLPAPQRRQAAAHISEPYRRILSEAVIDEAIGEVLRLLDDARFSFLFDGEALREVPIAGNVSFSGKTVAVSGQIDRLCIGDELWVVDYKSNRSYPGNTGDIPAAYIRQMALYRTLLSDIYPYKIIRCALLWTHAAAITLLDESLLSTYI
jgi:ATP-dependent helicase/nuclease subunit A